MADVISPSPRGDYSDSRFQFLSTSSKLSEDSFGSMSPLSPAMRDDKNNGRNGRQCCMNGSMSSYGQLSVCSDNSSMNSVFVRNKNNGDSIHGNDYSTGPGRKSSCPPNIDTSNNEITKHYVSRLYPTKSGRDDGTLRKVMDHGKSNKQTQEVTYTITDAIEDGGNQVILLPPPPPHEPDSDNDSVVGCDMGGPCSPRHHDWRESRDYGKSPIYRPTPGNTRCLCCMLLVFILSTAGLSSVLVLVYLGNLQLAPTQTVPTPGNQGRARLGEGALIREVCETGECLKTSSSILSRMNTSVEPCTDFYNYACGGFSKEVDLSWFRTRVREFPDEIMREHRKFIIDRLSDSFDPSDSKMMTSSKTIFRSCLFRSKSPDININTMVSEIFDSLGGLTSINTDASDLTQLLANVTRMFGASPFFKVIVHAQNKISLISQVSEYIDPWAAKKDLSRQKISSNREQSNINRVRLTELLVNLISGSVIKSEARGIVSNFFRLEENIRRILSSSQSRTGMYGNKDEIVCDGPGRKRTIGDLQSKYGGFGIDWFLFMESILDMSDVSNLDMCRVKLSLPLQHLLEITPKYTLRQFILLHTLLHSDLRVLYANDYQSIFKSDFSMESSQTEEDQCLGLLLHFIPSLEKFTDCDEKTLSTNKRNVFTTIKYVRSALYSILTDALRLSPANAMIVANATEKPIVESIKSELESSCRLSSGPQGSFSEYNFTANMLRVIQHHYGEYYLGRLLPLSRDSELAALWISSSAIAVHHARSGPIVYSSDVPTPVLYGSLGTFLATKIADGLGIEDLLDHHSEGVLNHSVVLSLAVRLKCFVKMYSGMTILDLGSQIYQANGELTKGSQWKDQLALKLIYTAWRNAERTLSTDHFIPGLTYTRPQLFFLSYAQTMCEKVNTRGILQHYVSDDAHPAIPSHQRLNGILKSSDEFSRAFQCTKGSNMNPVDKCHIFP